MDDTPPEEPPVDDTPPEEPPVDDTPPEEPPVDDTPPEEPPPVDDTPTEEPPVDDTPPEEPPMDDTPPEEPPVDDTPPEEPPVDDTPPEEPPVDDTSPEEPPVDDTPPEEPPVDDTPPEEPPVDETPPEEPPMDDTPPEEPLVDDTPPEEPPVDDTPPEEPPVDDTPPEEPPVDDTPPEEPPVDDTPPEEPPVDDTPPEEPPVDDTPPEEPPVDDMPPEEHPVDDVPSEELSMDKMPSEEEPPADVSPSENMPEADTATVGQCPKCGNPIDQCTCDGNGDGDGTDTAADGLCPKCGNPIDQCTCKPGDDNEIPEDSGDKSGNPDNADQNNKDIPEDININDLFDTPNAEGNTFPEDTKIGDAESPDATKESIPEDISSNGTPSSRASDDIKESGSPNISNNQNHSVSDTGVSSPNSINPLDEKNSSTKNEADKEKTLRDFFSPSEYDHHLTINTSKGNHSDDQWGLNNFVSTFDKLDVNQQHKDNLRTAIDCQMKNIAYPDEVKETLKSMEKGVTYYSSLEGQSITNDDREKMSNAFRHMQNGDASVRSKQNGVTTDYCGIKEDKYTTTKRSMQMTDKETHSRITNEALNNAMKNGTEDTNSSRFREEISKEFNRGKLHGSSQITKTVGEVEIKADRGVDGSTTNELTMDGVRQKIKQEFGGSRFGLIREVDQSVGHAEGNATARLTNTATDSETGQRHRKFDLSSKLGAEAKAYGEKTTYGFYLGDKKYTISAEYGSMKAKSGIDFKDPALKDATPLKKVSEDCVSGKIKSKHFGPFDISWSVEKRK